MATTVIKSRFLIYITMTNHFIILHPNKAVARPSVRSARVPNSNKKHRKTKIGSSSNTTNYIK